MGERIEYIYLNGVRIGQKVVVDGLPPPPATTPRMTKGVFIDRFPEEKHAAMLEMAKQSPELAAAKHKLDIREYVDISDPLTIRLIRGLEMIELLTTEEADFILSPISVEHIGAVLE